MKKLISWIKAHATKAAGVIALLTLILNSYALYQNSNALNVSKAALELSMEPSIDFQLYSNGAYIINTSNQTIKNICIYSITYVFNQNTSEIEERVSPSGNAEIRDQLLPREKHDIKAAVLVPLQEERFSFDELNVYRAVVITYRRTTDLKVFKALYVFKTFTVNGQLSLVGLSSGQASNGWSGPPQRYLKVIKNIEQIEKVMFKVEKFQ